jgi:surface antigen
MLGSNVFGDSIKDKVSKMNSKEPVVGGAVIMNSAKYPENGHVAIVQSINPDGTISIVDSNWTGDKTIGARDIKIDNKDIL